MADTKQCPKCGGVMYHNKGISQKNNKPYENWKCGSCKEVEWVNQTTTAPVADNKDVVLMETLKGINDRLDTMSEYFGTKVEPAIKELTELIKQFQDNDKVVFYPEAKNPKD